MTSHHDQMQQQFADLIRHGHSPEDFDAACVLASRLIYSDDERCQSHTGGPTNPWKQRVWLVDSKRDRIKAVRFRLALQRQILEIQAGA